MYLTDATVNAALDNILPSGSGNVLLSVHTDYSATGTNIHGSKTSANFSAASARSKALSGPCDITITGAITIKWVGAWSSDGNTFKGMVPNGGSFKRFQIDDTNNKIVCEDHGLIADNKVVFIGTTMPTGITAGTEYFVGTVTAGDPDSFSLSTTAGNANPVTITGQPSADAQFSKLVQEVYSNAGTHRVSTFTLAL